MDGAQSGRPGRLTITSMRGVNFDLGVSTTVHTIFLICIHERFPDYMVRK